MVNKLFSKVKIPTGKNEIKHMIKEYNFQVDDIVNAKINEGYKMLLGMIMIISIGVIGSLLIKDGKIVIKLVYTIPMIISGIYSIIINNRIRTEEFKNSKLIYKDKIITAVMLGLFFLNATYVCESILMSKWSYREYIFKLLIILILFLVFYIRAKVKFPKSFNREFVYGCRNKQISKKALNGAKTAAIIATAIMYRNPPCFILWIGCYLIISIFVQVVLYMVYKYSQYDYIQELKEEYKV